MSPPITNDAEYREDLTVELIGIAVACALLLAGAITGLGIAL